MKISFILKENKLDPMFDSMLKGKDSLSQKYINYLVGTLIQKSINNEQQFTKEVSVEDLKKSLPSLEDKFFFGNTDILYCFPGYYIYSKILDNGLVQYWQLDPNIIPTLKLEFYKEKMKEFGNKN